MKHDDGMPEFFDDLFDPGAFWLCSAACIGFLAVFIGVVGWLAGWW